MARLRVAQLFRGDGSSTSKVKVLARALSVFALILVCVGYALSRSARILVVNHPKPADVILVITTDLYRDDLYYYRAAHLLENHYGEYLLLPADATGDPGHTEADQARVFLENTAGAARERAFVCPEGADKFQAIGKCLDRLHAHAVLIVTPAPESRRCFLRYKGHLPQYSWSVAAEEAPGVFEDRWWSNRRWAKAYVRGLQRLIYAEIQQ